MYNKCKIILVAKKEPGVMAEILCLTTLRTESQLSQTTV